MGILTRKLALIVIESLGFKGCFRIIFTISSACSTTSHVGVILLISSESILEKPLLSIFAKYKLFS